MAIFVGNKGAFRLSRASEVSLNAMVSPADVSLTLNRVGIEIDDGELLTGDFVNLSTTDNRGLAFLAASNWPSAQIEKDISLFVNINAVGGVRFFRTFTDAANNDRLEELPVAAFTGDDLPVTIEVRDSSYRTLGRIESYQFNTERDALDTTSIHQSAKSQQPGLITGSGSLNMLFDYRMLPNEEELELPIVLFQTITRLRSGSAFDALLFLREPEDQFDGRDAVFYEFKGLITRAGVVAESDAIVSATVDFTVSGEYFLKIGSRNSYVLKEDDSRIQVEQSLGFILQEVDD